MVQDMAIITMESQQELNRSITHNFIHQSMADTKYRYKC